MKRILALDLGTSTGWALLMGRGTVVSGTWKFTTSRYAGGGERFLRFENQLVEVLDRGEPDLVVFEEVRAHAGTSAAHVYGGLLAVLTARLEDRQIPYEGVPVGTIKKHATGKGNAPKPAMMEAAARLFPYQRIQSDDQADALCLLSFAMEQYGGLLADSGQS